MNKLTIIQAAKTVLASYPEGLTAEEIYNRIIEQKLYEFKAKQPYNILLVTIRRQCYGIDFPSAYPLKHFKYNVVDGKTLYSLLGTAKAAPVPSKTGTTLEEVSTDLLPEERIVKAHEEHIEALRKQLLDSILDEDKSKTERAVFFEKLVVDLILSLGYGSDEKSGFITGRSHDGGIDGVIHEDKLGLDKIYIQAKCYAQSQTVSSKDVQAFVGAMTNVQKGIFVTSSRFSKDAHKYVEKQQSKYIKLIDGEALTGLMVKHSVGLITVKHLPIYKIDKDYFDTNS
jgi:restriction system protein